MTGQEYKELRQSVNWTRKHLARLIGIPWEALMVREGRDKVSTDVEFSLRFLVQGELQRLDRDPGGGLPSPLEETHE